MTPTHNVPQSGKHSSDNIESLSNQRSILLGRRGTAFGLTSFLFLATLLWTSLYEVHPSPAMSPANNPGRRLQTGIDPNTARWFEIAQLPGIGEALAKRVEAFREHRRTGGEDAEPVFRKPADLAQVKGIGEKTVQRIGPYLRLPGP